ncbi:MAG TPA: cupredoxin family copper-binding protein [Anaerolineales bacterium]|nr:cupredoxin family copper-binding protein [Anaerolineales bacterium]
MKIRTIFYTLIIASLLAACSPATATSESQTNQQPPATQEVYSSDSYGSTNPTVEATDTNPTQAVESSVPSQPSETGSVFNVEISGFAFEDSVITIKVGDKVTWENHDNTSHSVVADDGSFESATLANNGTFSHTFTTAGTFTYHCGFHPSMTGTIIVQP